MKIPRSSDVSPLTDSDLLRFLIRQALSIQSEHQSEKSMASNCRVSRDPSTETELFQLLQIILAGIQGVVYIIVDLDLLAKDSPESNHFPWISSFDRFLADLKSRGSATKIKVLFVSYGSMPIVLSDEERAKCVVPAKIEVVTARQRKAGRTPQQYPLSFPLKSLTSHPRDRLLADHSSLHPV
ncbi:hypothetical protein NX059_010519 [Plenodomus lindquistii]|nr:hypothetical protein NX059_010519 [Plenodomus lindquistii]